MRREKEKKANVTALDLAQEPGAVRNAVQKR
jgi:hypothetical protein